jgi:nitrogen fixation protein NifB
MRVALAAEFGAMVSVHFGRAPEFVIADIDEDSYTWQIVERRANTPVCEGGGHNAVSFAETFKLIEDCQAVIAMRIGNFARREMNLRNILVVERGGLVTDLLDGYAAFIKKTRKRTSAAVRPRTAGTRSMPMSDKFFSHATEFPIERGHNVVDIRSHPCFSDHLEQRKARLHLPVSAACNIQCRFCVRSCNSSENRPGVSSGILAPKDAVETVRQALELCPDLAVVGIAGPGDAFASPHALEAFRLVHEAYPALIKCVSTNGLALPGKARILRDVGVATLTVTVNAVDPEITARIVSRILVDGNAVSDKEAGAILIRSQLTGIREAVEAGITVKVNTVLIPGINDGHIADIARTVSEAGAFKHNLIPLIPRHEFADIPAPTCEQIETARASASVYIRQFLHCAHCRADACGIPGESDFADKLYQNRVMETFSHG